MKKLLLAFLVVFLSSCNHKEKFVGRWNVNFIKSNSEITFEEKDSMNIRFDSDKDLVIFVRENVLYKGKYEIPEADSIIFKFDNENQNIYANYSFVDNLLKLEGTSGKDTVYIEMTNK